MLDDFPATQVGKLWYDIGGQCRVGLTRKFTSSRPQHALVQRCVLMTTDPGDLVLDPTCGSGTTAYVAEQWGRRWITIDTSRVALALARTRLMAAKYPYYLLADSADGIKKEAELTGQKPPPHETESDIRKGFVYKRVPHVTLKSIANNPDIKEGMTRAEIDAAIRRHAETETLYDQPYEDKNLVRVTGPFTVESLSPHRIVSTDEERPPPSSSVEAPGPRRLRDDDPRQPAQGRRPEHGQERAAQVRHAGAVRRSLDSRHGRRTPTATARLAAWPCRSAPSTARLARSR